MGLLIRQKRLKTSPCFSTEQKFQNSVHSFEEKESARDLFTHFILKLVDQKRKESIKMAAEMKANQTIEEMTQMSTLDLVSQTDFYRQEEKAVKSVAADDVRIARRWSASQEEQFQDASKKFTIMKCEHEDNTALS